MLFNLSLGVLFASLIFNILPFWDAIGRVLEVAVFFSVFVSINYFVLLPRLWARQRMGYYVGSLLLLVAVLTFLRLQVARPLLMELFIAPVMLERPTAKGFVLISFFAMWLISTLYWMTESWFLSLRERSELKSQKLETELRFLKAQINPHFLFNTLNNLYTLCLLQDAKAAPMVLKLSNILRYVLDEGSHHTVTLQKEVLFLQDFIDLQQLKTDFTQDIQLALPEVLPPLRVPPLLFLTLLENSFKHGNVDTDQSGWVRAELCLEDAELVFEVRNSFDHQKKTVASGIGLENVRKRLALMYADTYTLYTTTDNEVFTARIRIPQKKLYHESPTLPDRGR